MAATEPPSTPPLSPELQRSTNSEEPSDIMPYLRRQHENKQTQGFSGPPDFVAQMQTRIDQINSLLSQCGEFTQPSQKPAVLQNLKNCIKPCTEIKDLYNSCMAGRSYYLHMITLYAIDRLQTETEKPDNDIEVLLVLASQVKHMFENIQHQVNVWRTSMEPAVPLR